MRVGHRAADQGISRTAHRASAVRGTGRRNGNAACYASGEVRSQYTEAILQGEHG